MSLHLPPWCLRSLAALGALAALAVLFGFDRVILSPADAPCKILVINAKGAANTAITVDATVGGITIRDALATRCAALVENESGGGDIRCTTGTLVPTATVGVLIPAGQSLATGLESQQVMKCIRTGAVSATVSTVEARPL